VSRSSTSSHASDQLLLTAGQTVAASSCSFQRKLWQLAVATCPCSAVQVHGSTAVRSPFCWSSRAGVWPAGCPEALLWTAPLSHAQCCLMKQHPLSTRQYFQPPQPSPPALVASAFLSSSALASFRPAQLWQVRVQPAERLQHHQPQVRPPAVRVVLLE
jgi:hypothetical protein